MNSAERFHKHRIAFAWLDNKWIYNMYDKRDHLHWLCEDYELTVEEFETIPRGYMINDRIQLFIGMNFREIDNGTLSLLDIQELLNMYHSKYGDSNVCIYNGVIIGNIGEVWQPKSKIEL